MASKTRTGLSKRKPATTRSIIETREESSESESKVEEMAQPSQSSSSKVDHSHNSETHNTEFESNIEENEDDRSVLPEGTISPEAVSKLNSPFKGPDFEKMCNKLKAEGNVGEMIICCTSCSTQINHKMAGTVFVHPLLHVLLCRKCKNFYNSGGFTKDENGIDEYCRWCAEGGDLLCCDSCSHAFCKACIRRNFGRSELSKISKLDVWECLICNSSPLLELQATCFLVLNYIKKESKLKSEKNSSHARALFSSPSIKVTHKVAIEICMENAVQTGRFLRDGIAVLRKKLVSANDPNVYAERVGNKLKKFLQVTKENLDSVVRAIDRELAKMPTAEQSRTANGEASAVRTSSSTKGQKLVETVLVKNVQMEVASGSSEEFQPFKPALRIIAPDKTEFSEEASTKCSKSDIEKSDEMINGNKASLSKIILKADNSQQNPVIDDQLASTEPSSYELILPDIEMECDHTDANVTEEHVEESESLENITPNNDNVTKDTEDIMRSSGDEVANEETILDNDTTLLASHVTPLKNNDNINLKTSNKKPKKVDKINKDDGPSKKLKIVLKKLPSTNDLDRDIVKMEKLEKKRNKQSRKREKDKTDGKPSRKSDKRASSASEKTLLENSTLKDSIREFAFINETEDVVDLENGADGVLKEKRSMELDDNAYKNDTTYHSNESNSDAETLIADAYVGTASCTLPEANSEDGENWDSKQKKRSRTSDDISDAETIPGSFNSDFKIKLQENPALKDVADTAENDSGNDATISDDPYLDNGSDGEASKGDITNLDASAKSLTVVKCEGNNVDKSLSSESKPSLKENEEKNVNLHAVGSSLDKKCLFSDISDGEEQATVQVNSMERDCKNSQRKVDHNRKTELETTSVAPYEYLKDLDNNEGTVFKGIPSDKNAKRDLLNRLLDDSEDEEENLHDSFEKRHDDVPETGKIRPSGDSLDSHPPRNKGVSPVNSIKDSEEGGMTCAKDGELSEVALAKKKLLNCLQSDSDNDDITRSSIQGAATSPVKSSPRKNRIPKPKSARGPDEMSSASSLSSDEEVALPKTKAARKIIPIADIQKFISEDPKLKLKVAVALQPLKVGVIKQLTTCGIVLVKRKQKAILNEEEALDRDIKRICNLKSLQLKKKRKTPESDSDCSGSSKNKVIQDGDRGEMTETKEGKPANTLNEKKIIPDKKKPKKDDFTALFTSSSEDENPDSVDVDEVDVKGKINKLNDENDTETKSMNKRAKDMLSELLKMSSDELSDEDDGDTEKKSKNAKKEKDGKKAGSDNSDNDSNINNSDDDSDDFTPIKKSKRFNSKLLRAKLSDSDESYKASSDSRDVKKRKKRNAANSKGSNSSESSNDSSEDVTSAKTRKRRTRGNAKSSTSTDGDSHSITKKKKRRRIKTMTDSSDSDVKVVEDKNATPSGKGRKNIRRVIRDTKLRDDTKFAAREEEERRNRVTELQKQYNVVIAASGKDGAPITQKLVLEKDSNTNESIVEVHPDLIFKLKPHQVDGVKFLWESLCESLERLQTHHGSGCILAHCMGLGKTLQVISFLHALLTNEKTCIKTALVVCPLNTVINWFMEFRNWLDEIEPSLEAVYELSSVKSNYERARAMKHWSKEGGVMIIGYEMFRNLVQEKGKRMPKSCKATFQSALINPGPDIVVCDEGHLLKNSTTSLSKAMSRIDTRRRVVLTGTPLQNNLAEYHCMVDFVKPSLLGTMKEFKNRFVNPIQNGQCADSTSQDVRIMKRRAHILHNLLDGCVQRRDYNVLTPFLPQKHEYVISIRLTEIQVKLYVYYLENLARKSARSSSLFSDYQQLMRIWTHPRVIRLAEIRQENKIRMKPEKHKNRTTKCMSFRNGQRPSYDDSENSFIDDETTESESDSNVVCIDNDEQPSTSKGRKTGDGTSDDEVVNNWKSRSRGGRQNADADVDLEKNEANTVQSSNWWTEFISEDDAKKFEHSGKLILLFSILKECYNIGDKLLLFSQSLLSLDLIETMLQESSELNDDGTENPHYAGKWVNGSDYFRLDGSTSADTRSRYTRIFNDAENFTARLFLISTRAGSLGINLVAANRVIVFDASWNPSHDVQSIFRVYRFGQEKPVYVYRFLAHGTMEEKIYDRQVTKQSLACRVVDEQQIERHFNFSDLQELYTFTPERVSKRPTPKLPKDRLLAELLIKKKELIVNYHEHDSLLVNQEAEELSEEERKAAWVEYEVERKGMIDSSGQQMANGLYGVKLDIASLIHGIQEKEPGLSVTELTDKLQNTIAAIHLARRQALEQQRQEILRVQMQNQQRELMAAQQKREMMAQIKQRIEHGDFTPEQAAWYSQVMGTDQTQLNKLLLQPNSYVTASNANASLKPPSSMLSSIMENFKNASNK